MCDKSVKKNTSGNYSKVVWVEPDSKEYGDIVPQTWITVVPGMLLWPDVKRSVAKHYISTSKAPENDWLKFKLVKVKFTGAFTTNKHRYITSS